jgi:flagellar export protein FliJ
MRRFRFRLQPLRDVRRHREREVEVRLGLAAGALASVDRQLDELAASRATTTVADVVGAQARAATPATPVLLDAAALGSAGWFMRGLEQREQALRTEREDCARQLAAVAAEYSALAKERKVLDKLRERQEREYVSDQRKQEQAALDETAQSRSIYLRRNRRN